MVKRYNTADYFNEFNNPDKFNEKFNTRLREIIRNIIGYSVDCRVHMRYINSEPDRGEDSLELFMIRVSFIPITEEIPPSLLPKCVAQIIKFLKDLGFKKLVFKSFNHQEYIELLIIDWDAIQEAKTLAEEIFN